MIFNIVVFLMAIIYWYLTGHIAPALFGIVLLLSLYNDELYFVTLILSAITVGAVIYYFWLDFFASKISGGILEFTPGIIYMLVIFLKAKIVFDNDNSSLD
ncbi:MAG: hypothetical protein OQK48_00330 [Sulfurimonas sp.]|uniref:hypothetical protein n=1 Tax=Sulfurimonas sp. TaxID=2022749 RepID=UPI002608D4E6|nr:hypothetical protein [Sulfurimonas sp.]MCW8894216.1 hypothetical protein [Sulfurimonas sp.]MCW8953369.1 hypothetical protein [Sulfurimonas sp.]MCW9067261.1 hypothetical protein [Sulfurimonas sp.]